jgi:ribonuclease PH
MLLRRKKTNKMKTVLVNRGLNRVWEISDPKTTAAAFREMLSLNEDGNRQLDSQQWLIEKIEKLEPGGLYDTWFALAQAIIMMCNLRTYAEILVVNDDGAVLYKTQPHIKFIR